MSRLLTPATSTARSSAQLFAPIAADLEQVERIYSDTIANSTPAINRLLGQLHNYNGKRLRPSLLLLTARACGEVTRNHHILGAVVEMVHTATLVHDDVLDEATTRRHGPTVNAGWGNKSSILLGDYLFTHAFHLSSMTGEARACRIIGEATNRVCEGELHQTLERGNLDLTEDDYLTIIDAKTAALTACCCRLGAMYAGASDALVERLTSYGRLLGMAFQVADDLLDVIGHERAAGKTLGTDLDQLKLTLPLIRMLDAVPAKEAHRLRQLLREGRSHRRERISEALAQTDAVTYARQRAERFAADAAAELADLPSSQFREILVALPHWAVRRDA
jgi:octaprenyl-diphosphate synthase